MVETLYGQTGSWLFHNSPMSLVLIHFRKLPLSMSPEFCALVFRLTYSVWYKSLVAGTHIDKHSMEYRWRYRFTIARKNKSRSPVQGMDSSSRNTDEVIFTGENNSQAGRSYARSGIRNQSTEFFPQLAVTEENELQSCGPSLCYAINTCDPNDISDRFIGGYGFGCT